jgi:phage/plasmid-associated DNA primase
MTLYRQPPRFPSDPFRLCAPSLTTPRKSMLVPAASAPSNGDGFAEHWDNWIRSGAGLLPKWAIEAQDQRDPPEHPIFVNQQMNVSKLLNLATVVNNSVPTYLRGKAYFQFQVLRENNSKQFEHANPTRYSLNQLRENQHLLDRVLTDPTFMLSLSLTPDMGIVCLDLDPPGEAVHPLENSLLEGLQDLLNMGEAISTNLPIVVQTPRGLHILFAVPKVMTPKITQARDYLVRLGVRCELITSGNCVLYGLNYRVITSVIPSDPLPYLPYGFQPLSKKTSAIEVTAPIEVGHRYLTLMACIDNNQWVYLANGAIILWAHEFFCLKDENEERLTGPELDYLLKRHAAKWARTKRDARSGPNAQFSGAGEPPLSSRKLTTATGWQAFLTDHEAWLSNNAVLPNTELKALGRVLNDTPWANVAPGIRMETVVLVSQWVYGSLYGTARAIARMVGGTKRVIIYNLEEQSYYFYNDSTDSRIWVPMDDYVFQKTIQDIMDTYCSPINSNRETQAKVGLEVQTLIGVPFWGKLVMGYAYGNGYKVLGCQDLLPFTPELQIMTRIDTDHTAGASLSTITETYFRNLTYYNPAILALLRYFIFATIFDLAKPSHFLYIQGKPSSGKSLLVQLLEHLLGAGAVYRLAANAVDDTFAFCSLSTGLKTVVFEDADNTQNSARLMSFLKEHCTQDVLSIKIKFQNKEIKVSGVYYILVVNQFLRHVETLQAIERRQIIIQPRSVSVQQINTDLINLLKQNTDGIIRWLEETPRILGRVLTYSASLNYMTTSTDFSFNPVADFLFANLENLFVTPNNHTSLSDIPFNEMNDGKQVYGLYQTRYLQWFQETETGNKPPLSLRQFDQVLSELSRTAFFLTASASGDYTGSKRVPLSKGVDRLVWLNISFAKEDADKADLISKGAQNLIIKMPLEGAVLALLHPNTKEMDTGGATTPTGITIHEKYPVDWLEMIFGAIQIGPEASVEAKVLGYRAKVGEILEGFVEKEKQRQVDVALFQGINFANVSPENMVVPLPLDADEPSAGPAQEEGSQGEPELLATPLDFAWVNPSFPGADSALEGAGLTKESGFAELYSRILHHQKSASRPDYMLETSAGAVPPAKSATYISKYAFNQLTTLWIRDAKLDKEAYYSINKTSQWDEVLSNNEAIGGEAPILVWKDNVIVSVTREEMPPGTNLPQVPQPTPVPPDGEANPVNPQVATPQPGAIVDPVFAPQPPRRMPGTFPYYPGRTPAPRPDAVLVPTEAGNEPSALPEEEGPRGPLVQPVVGLSPSEEVHHSADLEDLWLKLGNQPHFVPDTIPPNPRGSIEVRNVTVLRKQEKARVATLLTVFIKENAVARTSLLTLPVLAAALFNGGALNSFKFKTERSFNESNWFLLVTPAMQEEQVDDAFLQHIRDRILRAAITGSESMADVKSELLEELVYTPLKELLKDQPDLISYRFETGLNEASFFIELALVNWSLGYLTPESWKNPFPCAKIGEETRSKFASWTNHCRVFASFNNVLEPFLGKVAIIFSVFARINDLAFGDIAFSEKTWDHQASFFWKTLKVFAPFSSVYLGGPDTRDPGRLGIQGTGYTTYPKIFREEGIHPLFNVIGKEKKISFFIIDIQGAHASFQAALLKEKTPLLFKFFKEKKVGQTLWEYFAVLSNGGMTIADKDIMKTLFYAAANGGSIATLDALKRHLYKSNKPASVLYNRIPSFVEAFLTHPLGLELVSVQDYWKSLNGCIYVPTRQEPVFRRLTQKEADKKNRDRPASSAWVHTAGTALPQQLPSVYYCALEVILMTKILGWTYQYFRDTEGAGAVAYLQGMHDGILLCADATVDLLALREYVNTRLDAFTGETLGLTVKVSCETLKGCWYLPRDADSVCVDEIDDP